MPGLFPLQGGGGSKAIVATLLGNICAAVAVGAAAKREKAARMNVGITIAARLREDGPRTLLGVPTAGSVSVVIIVFSSVAAHVEHNWTFAIIVPPILP